MEVMKRLRQQQIRDLITTRAIRTQHELAAALRERGFRATRRPSAATSPRWA